MARQLFALVLTALVLAILFLSCPSEAANIEQQDYACTFEATAWKASNCSGPYGGRLIDALPSAKSCTGVGFFGHVGSFLIDCTVKRAYFYPYLNCRGQPQILPNGVCTPVKMPNGSKFSLVLSVNGSLSH